jgi:hypothetical protein
MVNWQRSIVGRATALLSIAAWIFGVGQFAIIASVVALLPLCFNRMNSREAKLVFFGSCAVLTLAVAWRIASDLEFTDVHYMDASLPLWLRRTMSFVHDGFAPATLLGVALWGVRSTRTPLVASLCSVLGVAAIVGLVPFVWSIWTTQEFSEPQIARFASWRNIIEPGQEVFWGESPLSTWVLLNRPSYISGLQTSGMIFSRASALELKRRALALKDNIGPATFLSWSGASAHLSLSRDTLQRICHSGEFAYLVTGADLDAQPIATLDRLKLYACTPQARAAAAAT